MSEATYTDLFLVYQNKVNPFTKINKRLKVPSGSISTQTCS